MSRGGSADSSRAGGHEQGPLPGEEGRGEPRADFLQGDFIVSHNDDRKYRRLLLPNGLKVILVHDPNVDKAGAAMSINIGHFKDPKEIPGLAHFLEHMLFLGTKKYPEENAYSLFLNQHGGNSNAYTSHEHTNFYFEVAHSHLEGALDRFAQFFLEPLFTPSCTEREIEAVNSENKRNLQNDAWRFLQLEKHLSNPLHEFNSFGTGNSQTLKTTPEEKGLDTRSILLDFYERYYSANIMGLCLLGRESLDELEAMATSKFSGIRNRNTSIAPIHDLPLDEEHLTKMVYVVPVQDIHQLDIIWQLPSSDQYFLEKPDDYLAHLIGHEGPGSILSYLKKYDLGFGLSAGVFYSASTFSLFKVSIELTVKGRDKVNEIITVVFQYLDMLRRTGAVEDIYLECQKLHDISFRFREKLRTATYVSKLSANIHQYPGQYLIAGPSLYFKYDPKLIERFLGYLSPRNFRCFQVNPDFKNRTDLQQEPWYGTQYAVEALEETFLKSLESPEPNPKLFIHPKNEFIADDFTIKADPHTGDYPIMLRDSSTTRLWYKKDNTFLVPKANIQILIRNSVSYATPQNAVGTVLLSEILMDELNEFSYAAELAGLKYELSSNSDGLKLSIFGFNAKQSILVEKILSKISSFSEGLQDEERRKEREERFAIQKHILDQAYKNWNYESPANHVYFNMTWLTQELAWRDQDKIVCLQAITLPFVSQLADQIMTGAFLEIFVIGNMTREEAKGLADQAERHLHLQTFPPSSLGQSRAIYLEKGTTQLYSEKVFNPENENSAIEVYYQLCHYDQPRERCLVQLLHQCFKERFFDQLRTKEQLGYVVSCAVRSVRGSYGLKFLIQSLFSPAHLQERIEAFLEEEKVHLSEMSEQEFENHVKALIFRKLEKPKNLRQETDQLWKHISTRSYDFDSAIEESEILSKITKAEMCDFFLSGAVKGGAKLRRLVVWSVSQRLEGGPPSPPSGAVLVDDPAAYKASRKLFPSLAPSRKFLTLAS